MAQQPFGEASGEQRFLQNDGDDGMLVCWNVEARFGHPIPEELVAQRRPCGSAYLLDSYGFQWSLSTSWVASRV